MSVRSELMAEAEALELTFKKNIKTTTLQAMVAEAKGEPVPVDEVAPPSPAMKADKPKAEIVDDSKKTPLQMQRERIKSARAKAFKTSIVTVTNKDNRENDVMTTAYLSFENQHFGLSKLVPLDVALELEQGLIDVAESTNITLHKDEIVRGQRTGNKVAVTVKKFSVSYAKVQ